MRPGGFGAVGVALGSLLVGCASDTSAGDFCSAPPRGVVEIEVDEAPEGCPLSGTPCMDAYLALPTLAPDDVTHDLSDAQLDDQIALVRSGDWPQADEDLDPEALAFESRRAARLDWMLDGFDGRSLRVEVLERDDSPGARSARWIADDPLVGRFSGTTLLPDGDGPHPALVVAHGHNQSGADWASLYDARSLADEGYVVFLPDARVSRADEYESAVTKQLLLNGLTFVGVRSYEHLVTLKYAASLSEVDACRVGLVGHSGGSVAANLTTRVSLGFVAVVTDLVSDFYQELQGGILLDETSPAVHGLAPEINDLSDVHVPVLKVDYGYVEPGTNRDRWPEIRTFLHEHLRD